MEALDHIVLRLSFGPEGWGDELLRGAGMTILLATASYALGLLFGIVAAGIKVGGGFVLRWLMEVYTTVIRGVPELLVIYLLFFGTQAQIQSIMAAVGDFGAEFVIGVLAVGLISGAYATEVLRGALLAVPRGQIEAGRAFGMHRFLLFRRVVLPQTLRLALPGLGNVWQLILKDTALVSVTGVTELLRMSSVAARSTREPFIFFITAAILFLVITTVSQKAFRRVEAHYDRGTGEAEAPYNGDTGRAA
jgi:octopine/nopaline transport system permease protein